MLPAMLTQCLALLLPISPQGHLTSRRSVLQHGAVVASFALPAAAVAADVTLGSSGISSYEKLKLDTANNDLAEAVTASTTSALKQGLEAYAAALKLIANSEATKDTAKKLDAAGELLQKSATSGTADEGLLGQAAAIEKQTRATVAACEKKDIGPAAVSAAKLADGLTDLAYTWTAQVRPLAEVTIEQPDLKPKGGYVDNPKGILGSKKGGML